MSSQDQEQDQYQEQSFGGRKRRHTAKKHSKKNTVVVGKVYADWCGHCQSLKPEWAKMKKRVYSKKGKKQVVFVEIEEKQIGDKLQKIEKEHGVKVEANGYPTLFRIEGGKVNYYTGIRQSDAMANWYLRGSDPVGQGGDTQMPGLMQDLQGGRRVGRHGRHTRYRGKNYNPSYNQHKGTRKQFEKKTPGFLDFLFGK